MDATIARLRTWGASGAHFGIIATFAVFAAFPFYWMLITTTAMPTSTVFQIH